MLVKNYQKIFIRFNMWPLCQMWLTVQTIFQEILLHQDQI